MIIICKNLVLKANYLLVSLNNASKHMTPFRTWTKYFPFTLKQSFLWYRRNQMFRLAGNPVVTYRCGTYRSGSSNVVTHNINNSSASNMRLGVSNVGRNKAACQVKTGQVQLRSKLIKLIKIMFVFQSSSKYFLSNGVSYIYICSIATVRLNFEI